MQLNTKTLRSSLGASADIAKLWFESRAKLIAAATFKDRGQLGDNGSGAVYTYYDEKSFALYVGQTGRPVKARLHDQTSPHKDKDWWEKWTHMRFVQLSDEMDRLVLEFLLILAYSPSWNEKPKAKDLHALLPE